MEPLNVFAVTSKPGGLMSVRRTDPEWLFMSYRPAFVMLPEYSMAPLTDFAPSRSHVTSLITTSPLTELNSRPCALTLLPRTLPLTLAIDTSVSVDTPENDTSPDTLLATSSFGVSVNVTLPLTVSARTTPRTPESLTDPDTE